MGVRAWSFDEHEFPPLYTVRLSGTPPPGDRVVLSAAPAGRHAVVKYAEGAANMRTAHVVVEARAANMREVPFEAARLESGVVGATRNEEEAG